eukprot:843732_1
MRLVYTSHTGIAGHCCIYFGAISMHKRLDSHDAKIFKTTRDKLKQMHKDGKLKKNYAVKHCSASWATSEDTDFLYLRPYITTADNKRHFDPSWLCVACNHYYAKHPECKYI